MNSLIRCLLGVCVAAGAAVLAEPHQHRFSASQNDILSGLTWATLDLAHLGQPDYLASLDGINLAHPNQPGYLASLDGLNLTLPDLYNNSLASRRPRTRRLMKRTADNPVAIELEVRYIVPLFTVYESDNVNFEVPISHTLELPSLLKVVKVKGERRLWDETLGTMFTDLEGLVSMLGVDGSGCVRKALCEVAAMPSIVPEGLVGEMLQLFVRHLAQEGEAGELDETDLVLEESGTREKQENSEEEKQTEEPETDKQKDGIGEEKWTGETDEHEEKSGKQKESEKSKTGKERSRRRRPRKIDEYVAAGDHGRQRGDCWAAFSQCPLSLLHLNNHA